MKRNFLIDFPMQPRNFEALAHAFTLFEIAALFMEAVSKTFRKMINSLQRGEDSNIFLKLN